MKKKACAIVLASIILSFLIVSVFPGFACAAGSKTNKNVRVPKGCYNFGKHSYKFYQGGLTWTEAKEFCERMGGHLATINSRSEWSFIHRHAKRTGNHLWLGAFDKNHSGQWQWVTDEPWNFTAWSSDYPNSKDDADYLYMSCTRNYQWFNWTDTLDDNASQGFICEWDFTPKKYYKVIIPGDSYAYNGHHYIFFPYTMNWSDAKAFCKSLGGHLATVTSAGEWSFIQAKAKANTGHFWLGATDKSLEGEWKWITNEEWSFTAWSEEYPNENRDADYLYISSTRDYTWYNWSDTLDNNAPCGFICEWDYTCISSKGYYKKHKWSKWTTVTEASCNGAGYKERSCKSCGKKESQNIPQLTHRYGEYVIVSGSKLIPPIVKERTCSLCNHVQTYKDWSNIWITILVVIGVIGVIVGTINYFRAFKKTK